MKNFDRLIISITAVLILIIVLANVRLLSTNDNSNGRLYRVEAERVAAYIEKYGFEKLDLSEYRSITGIFPASESYDNLYENSNEERFNVNDFFNTQSDYMIKIIDGKLYRIEYTSTNTKLSSSIIFINAFFSLMLFIILFILFYIRQNILKPFLKLSETPYELSRGNLTIPLKENKNHYFGRFVWGLNLLREKLETQKENEIKLQKDNKTLMLSLSHDIKTPLSAIKLYSIALSKGLYTDIEKQKDTANKINEKADDIENYVSEIIKASNENFLSLEVKSGEFYLSEVIEKIKEFYIDKLALIHINFTIEKYDNCLLKGDPDRFVEVLQNIIENAVKYGDGREIIISFEQENECLLITIKNSGCTLPENELPHIFDSFWRGSNKGNNSGSGLGLYICRQLMHKMGGEIFAKIENAEMYVTIAVII